MRKYNCEKRAWTREIMHENRVKMKNGRANETNSEQKSGSTQNATKLCPKRDNQIMFHEILNKNEQKINAYRSAIAAPFLHAAKLVIFAEHRT